MKTQRIIWLFIISIFAVACDDDDSNNITPSSVSSTVSDGSWIVTLYQDRDDNETSNFSGYTFDFNSSAVVIASKGDADVVGTWSSSESSSKVKLVLSFPASPLDELNEDWEVIEKSDNTIKLKHVSGGDGHVDFLTFQKS